MAKRKSKTVFDPFDGRSVRIKSNAELADGLTRVQAWYEDSWDAPAHAAMWKATLAEINSEVRYRHLRDAVSQ